MRVSNHVAAPSFETRRYAALLRMRPVGYFTITTQ